MPLVTFIIPVRHQDNARDWGLLKKNLAQTITSISNQSSSDWQAIVVANEGADLPEMPERFRVKRVTFPPNDMHELGGSSSKDGFLDAFRYDKGRRVLMGMLDARDSRFFMIVDDDDFVSSRIVRYVSEHPEAPGWVIDHGYVWDDGSRIVLGHDQFNRLCGTSLIVRSDLYRLPSSYEQASPDWIKSNLGSHKRIGEILAASGNTLRKLPFRGAIYRVAHGGSHSKTPSLLVEYFANRAAVRRPLRLLQNASKLRWVTDALRREFFGLTARDH